MVPTAQIRPWSSLTRSTRSASRGDLVRFGVHGVLSWIFHLDGLERTRADLQIEPGNHDTGGREPLEHCSRKVEPSGGCGDASFGLRVDGLVARLVDFGGRPRDVGRQRELAMPGDGIFRAQSVEADDAVAVGKDFQDIDPGVGGDREALPGLQRAARFSHRKPGSVGTRMDQQNFRGGPGGTGADEARVAHPCRVEHQKIARRDQRRQFVEGGVDQGGVTPEDREESAVSRGRAAVPARSGPAEARTRNLQFGDRSGIKDRRLCRWRRNSEPAVGQRRGTTATLGSLEKTLLDQIRLVDILERPRVLSDRHRHGAQTHRTPAELLDDGGENTGIHVVQSELVHVQASRAAAASAAVILPSDLTSA